MHLQFRFRDARQNHPLLAILIGDFLSPRRPRKLPEARLKVLLFLREDCLTEG